MSAMSHPPRSRALRYYYLIWSLLVLALMVAQLIVEGHL